MIRKTVEPGPTPVNIQPATTLTLDRVIVVTALMSVSLLIQLSLSLHAPFWRDEAQTIFIARLPRWSSIVDALAHDGAAPLFYLILRHWMSLFGESQVAIRLLPILLSSLAPPILFLAGANLVSRPVGLAAAGWLLLNPVVAEAGGQVRMYGLVTSLGIITFWAWMRFFRNPTVRHGLVGAIGNILLLYAHNVGGIVLLTTQIAWLVWAIRARRRKALDGRTTILWLGLQGIIAVAYLPWAPVLLRQIGYQVAPWAEPPNLVQAIGALTYFFPMQFPAPWDLRTCLAAALLLAFATVRVFRQPKLSHLRPIFALSIGGIVLYAVVCQFSGAFGPRYLLPWVPMLSLGIFAFAGIALARAARWAVPLSLIILAVIGLDRQWDRLAHPTNAPAIAEALTTASADDLVVVPWQAGAPAISYYLPSNQGVQSSFPTRKRVEIIDWAFIEKSLNDDRAFQEFLDGLAADVTEGKTVWIVCRSAAPPPGQQKFLNLETSREMETIQNLVRITGAPALKVPGCDCSRESFSLLRFEKPAHLAHRGVRKSPS